jgi:hypothetical protein
MLPSKAYFQQLIPFKILQAPIQAALFQLSPPAAPRSFAPKRTLSPTLDDSATWLPALQKWLPHTWVDTSSILVKAVKNDKAAVDTGSWDNHIVLLVPHVEPLIIRLRNWLLLVQRQWATR